MITFLANRMIPLKHQALATLLLTAPLILSGRVVKAEDRGLVLSLSCMACHAPGDDNSGAIPTLSGKSAQELVIALRQFRNGTRKATIMDRIAKGYTDAEIRQLARALAQRKP